MKKSLPEKRSKNWVSVFVIMTVVIFLYASITGIVIAWGDATLRFFLGILGISILISITSCLLGYYGLRISFWLVVTSIITGLVMMTYAYSQGGPWNNVIGILDLILFYGIGLILGVIIEIARFIYNKIKSKKALK